MNARIEKVNHTAIGELYQCHASAILAHCLTILGESADAADALQDSFLRVLDHQQPDAQNYSIGYLYRTSTNACIDVLRQKGVRKRAAFQMAAQAPMMSMEQNHANRDYLRVLFDRCDVTTAFIGLYHLVHGMDQVEVAARLGLSRRTVFNHLKRLEQLAAELLSDGCTKAFNSGVTPTQKDMS